MNKPTKKDKSKISEGTYCYCKDNCLYKREVPNMNVDFSSYVCDTVVVCDYLNVNTMSLILDGLLNSFPLEDSCKTYDDNLGNYYNQITISNLSTLRKNEVN